MQILVNGNPTELAEPCTLAALIENLDLTVLRSLLQWRIEGRRALLATVIHTWGSSPRPVGSIMALCESGAVVGSVSGGCIEDDLIHRYSPANTSAGAAACMEP